MILTIILDLLFNFVNFLLGNLPLGDIPTGITDALAYFVGVMNTFNYFFPISTLFQVLSITVAFELGVFIYHFSMWLYRLIRG